MLRALLVGGSANVIAYLSRVFVVLVALSLPAAAQEPKRLALLIGNETYSSEIGRLANPHNDVALLEQALKGLGFDVVTVHDAGLGALNRAVNAYVRRVQAAGPNAVGFFYYSGHGASDGGTNYLIPIDVKSTEAGELWDESLRLTAITHQLKAEAGNATHFVVFDACRNTLRLTQPGSRAIVQSKGFVPVAQENGMLIAYATAEGELATDVGAGAGPYAKVLAEEIVKPGIEAVVMFRAVQLRVRAAIHQEPYVGFSALGNVYLAGKAEQVAATPAAPRTQVRLSEAAEAWDRTKDTTSIPVLELFIASYKDTYYAGLARFRIEELKTQQGTAHQAAIAAKKKADDEARAKAGAQRVAVATPTRPTPALVASRLDASSVIKQAGAWVSQFSINPSTRTAPKVFEHYFIVVEGDTAVSPGTIVVGKTWDPPKTPEWRAVHGNIRPISDDAWFLLPSQLSYLGPHWQAEYSALSDRVFSALDGKDLGKWIRHR